jgi:pilus assembly protein Flp/PilA
MKTLLAARGSTSRQDEAGQGLAEYALILALIAIVAIIALIFLGGQISDKISVVGNALQALRTLDQSEIRTHLQARRTSVRRAFACARATLHSTLQRAAHPPFTYQRVLAHWYSRAPRARCYSGATCHTTARGEFL